MKSIGTLWSVGACLVSLALAVPVSAGERVDAASVIAKVRESRGKIRSGRVVFEGSFENYTSGIKGPEKRKYAFGGTSIRADHEAALQVDGGDLEFARSSVSVHDGKLIEYFDKEDVAATVSQFGSLDRDPRGVLEDPRNTGLAFIETTKLGLVQGGDLLTQAERSGKAVTAEMLETEDGHTIVEVTVASAGGGCETVYTIRPDLDHAVVSIHLGCDKPMEAGEMTIDYDTVDGVTIPVRYRIEHALNGSPQYTSEGDLAWSNINEPIEEEFFGLAGMDPREGTYVQMNPPPEGTKGQFEWDGEKLIPSKSVDRFVATGGVSGPFTYSAFGLAVLLAGGGLWLVIRR